MTNDTWNLFVLRDIALILVASIGFLATIWGLTVANYRVNKREQTLRKAKNALKDAPTIETNVE